MLFQSRNTPIKAIEYLMDAAHFMLQTFDAFFDFLYCGFEAIQPLVDGIEFLADTFKSLF